ncbi:helix-turn-helix domain-containing protein [Pseudomonas luteola]|uniref:Helix-turn-helix transcriptional regulator n=1 Tax=Pseudomonas luteola TaxID=47886 RepID=A0ABS0N1E4_PSELU|nr:helix-turn-helix transcriptional regulator [Pseudomonas luteola]MBH3441832.1 helix-turn-helix transcriptional regulator [Pseudomonas luteola]QEU31473.1 helix-turn-helix transcriptional regulator [Pseudomonas luteola]
MSSIGSRLREERERLCLSQTLFGAIGGIKTNAQVKYEKDERSPDAEYLSALANKGVDVLYVLTGQHVPVEEASLSAEEARLLSFYRQMSDFGKESITHVAFAVASVNKGSKNDH